MNQQIEDFKQVMNDVYSKDREVAQETRDGEIDTYAENLLSHVNDFRVVLKNVANAPDEEIEELMVAMRTYNVTDLGKRLYDLLWVEATEQAARDLYE